MGRRQAGGAVGDAPPLRVRVEGVGAQHRRRRHWGVEPARRRSLGVALTTTQCGSLGTILGGYNVLGGSDSGSDYVTRTCNALYAFFMSCLPLLLVVTPDVDRGLRASLDFGGGFGFA